MKVYCIGSEDVVRGFALIGVEGTAPADANTVAAALEGALRREDLGLVLITERLAVNVEERIAAWSLARKTPLVLEIPDEAGKLPGRATTLALVREALGLGKTDE